MKKRWVGTLLLFLLVQWGWSQHDFVQVKEQQLYVKGRPYYFIGANYWYGPLLGMDVRNLSNRERLLKELDFLKKKGVTNLRVMAAVEGTGYVNGVMRVSPALQKSPGAFDDSLLRGLDFLLSEMGKRDMKAVLFLSNNWEWTGGFLQYVNWFGLVSDSMVQRKLDWEEVRDVTSRFYDCEPCREAYLKQVEHIITRTNSVTGKKYTDDPAIMAWQLANEPRPMRTRANEKYVEWIRQSAAFIKRLDKHHLVSIGHEGYMGTDGDLGLFERIHDDRNVDYLTIHIWPKNWGWFKQDEMKGAIGTIKNRATAYIATHEDIARTLNKPLIIEEFGLPRNDHRFDPRTAVSLRDEYLNAIFEIWQKSKEKNDVLAGLNFWSFAGTGRPVKGQNYWKEGDDYTGDPPMEEQGLNSIFDNDKSTWRLIQKYTR
ncbi:glycoside hydrolase 5 family protein [Niabella aquatica]